MSQSPQQNWKTLYLAAIFEKDSTLLPQRISEAENAVAARGRELLCHDGPPEEREEIENALYMLRAFRTACGHLD